MALGLLLMLRSERGYSLYLRPTMIGTQRTLGVGPPGSALLFLIASPVGPYYPTGFRAVSLEASKVAIRAWPGGVGNMKLGANYAPCIVPQIQAAKRGLHQNLWLFGEEDYVTEVGTMNFFAAVKDKETGRKTLMTAPLDGTILEGVIRDSVLDLARERLIPEGWDVQERRFTMNELTSAANEGRLLEAFGTGTAAIVSPVRRISWNDTVIECGLKENEEAGEIAKRMKDWVEGIQVSPDRAFFPATKCRFANACVLVRGGEASLVVGSLLIHKLKRIRHQADLALPFDFPV